MQLLQELTQLNENLKQDYLIEKLGNLTQLKLGKLSNALKQSYRGRGATAVGKKFANMYSGRVGATSEVLDIGFVKSFAQIRKVYRENENIQAIVLSTSGSSPAFAIIMVDSDTIGKGTQKVGMAYDLSSLELTDDQLQSLHLEGDVSTDYLPNISRSYKSSNVVTTDHEWEYNNLPRIPRNYKNSNVVTADDDSTYNARKTSYSYEGQSYTVNQVKTFIDGLEDAGVKLYLKAVVDDIEGYKKTSERDNNQPKDTVLSKTDLRIAKEDLQNRLQKYKNSKLESVDDIEEFLKKALFGEFKKLKFNGITYNVNNSWEPSLGITSRELLRGETVEIRFTCAESDSHQTMYVHFAIKDGKMEIQKVTQ